jgi:hypothetical protein
MVIHFEHHIVTVKEDFAKGQLCPCSMVKLKPLIMN